MVLGEDIVANEDFPSFFASTMDGYAIMMGESSKMQD
jgi:molybdopterin biosynthesis enzyme